MPKFTEKQLDLVCNKLIVTCCGKKLPISNDSICYDGLMCEDSVKCIGLIENVLSKYPKKYTSDTVQEIKTLMMSVRQVPTPDDRDFETKMDEVRKMVFKDLKTMNHPKYEVVIIIINKA
eukprot:UN34507